MSRKVEMNVVPVGWTQMELVLLFFGWEACDPAHYWGPGVRDSYIVHYIHEGRGTVYMEGQEYHLTQGQGFVILPDTVIHYEADSQDPWTYSWFGFKGVQAKAFLQRAQLNAEYPVFNAHDPDIMAHLYDDMVQATTRLRPGGDVLYQSLLYRLIAELISSSPELEQRASSSLAKRRTFGRRFSLWRLVTVSGHPFWTLPGLWGWIERICLDCSRSDMVSRCNPFFWNIA